MPHISDSKLFAVIAAGLLSIFALSCQDDASGSPWSIEHTCEDTEGCDPDWSAPDCRDGRLPAEGHSFDEIERPVAASAAVGPLGCPHVAYYEQHEAIHYARWDGSQWHRSQIPYDGLSAALRLDLSSTGQPNLAYAGLDLQYARLKPDETWVTTPISSSSAQNLAFGLDGRGRPVVIAELNHSPGTTRPERSFVSLVEAPGRWESVAVTENRFLHELSPRIRFDSSQRPWAAYSATTGRQEQDGLATYTSFLVRGDGPWPHRWSAEPLPFDDRTTIDELALLGDQKHIFVDDSKPGGEVEHIYQDGEGWRHEAVVSCNRSLCTFIASDTDNLGRLHALSNGPRDASNWDKLVYARFQDGRWYYREFVQSARTSAMATDPETGDTHIFRFQRPTEDGPYQATYNRVASDAELSNDSVESDL